MYRLLCKYFPLLVLPFLAFPSAIASQEATTKELKHLAEPLSPANYESMITELLLPMKEWPAKWVLDFSSRLHKQCIAFHHISMTPTDKQSIIDSTDKHMHFVFPRPTIREASPEVQHATIQHNSADAPPVSFEENNPPVLQRGTGQEESAHSSPDGDDAHSPLEDDIPVRRQLLQQSSEAIYEECPIELDTNSPHQQEAVQAEKSHTSAQVREETTLHQHVLLRPDTSEQSSQTLRAAMVDRGTEMPSISTMHDKEKGLSYMVPFLLLVLLLESMYILKCAKWRPVHKKQIP